LVDILDEDGIKIGDSEVGFITSATYSLYSKSSTKSTPVLRSSGYFLHSEGWTKTFTNLEPTEFLQLIVYFNTEDNANYSDRSFFSGITNIMIPFGSSTKPYVYPAKKQNSIDPSKLLVNFEPTEHGFSLKIGDYYSYYNNNIYCSLDETNSWVEIKNKSFIYSSTLNPLLPSAGVRKIRFKGSGNAQYYPTETVNAVETALLPILKNNNEIPNFKDFTPLKKGILTSTIKHVLEKLEWGFKITITEPYNALINYINVNVGNVVYKCMWNNATGFKKYCPVDSNDSFIGTTFINTTTSGEIRPSIPQVIFFEAFTSSVDYKNFSYSLSGQTTNKKNVTAPNYEVSTTTPKQIGITLTGDYGLNNEFCYVVYEEWTWYGAPTDEPTEVPTTSTYTPSPTYIARNLKEGVSYKIKIWYRNTSTSDFNAATFGSILLPDTYKTKYRVGKNVKLVDGVEVVSPDSINYTTSYVRNPVDTNYSFVSYNITFSNITCLYANSILANGINVYKADGTGSITLTVNEGDTFQLTLVASNTNDLTHYNTVTEVYRAADKNKYGVVEKLREIVNAGSNFIPFISRVRNLTTKLIDYYITEITADTVVNGRDITQINYWTVTIETKNASNVVVSSLSLSKDSTSLLSTYKTKETPFFIKGKEALKIYSDGYNKNKLYIICGTNNATIKTTCYGTPNFDPAATMNFLNVSAAIKTEFYKVGSVLTKNIDSVNTDIFKNNSVAYDVAAEPNYSSITLDMTQSFINSNKEEPNYYTIEYRKLEPMACPLLDQSGRFIGFKKLKYIPGSPLTDVNALEGPFTRKTTNQSIVISGLSEATPYHFVITPSITGANALKIDPSKFSRSVIFYTKGKMGVVDADPYPWNDTRNYNVFFATRNIYKLKVDREESLPSGVVGTTSSILTVVGLNGYTELNETYPATGIQMGGNIGSDTSIQFNYDKSIEPKLWEDVSEQYTIIDKASDGKDVYRKPIFDWVLGKDEVVVNMTKNKILLDNDHGVFVEVFVEDWIEPIGGEYKIDFGTDPMKDITFYLYVANIANVDLVATDGLVKMIINGVETPATFVAGDSQVRATVSMAFRTSTQSFTLSLSHPSYLNSEMVRVTLYSNADLRMEENLNDDAFKTDYFSDTFDLVSSLVVTKNDLLDTGSYDYTYGQFEISNTSATFLGTDPSTAKSSPSDLFTTSFTMKDEKGKVIFRPNSTIQGNSNNRTTNNIREGVFKVRLIPKVGLEKYFNPTGYVEKTFKFYCKKTFLSNIREIKKLSGAITEYFSDVILLKNKKIYEFFIAGLLSGHGGGGGRSADYWGHETHGGSGGAGKVVLFSNEWEKKETDNYPDDLIINTTLQLGMTGTKGIGNDGENEQNPVITWDEPGFERNTEMSFSNSVINLNAIIADGGSRGQSATSPKAPGGTENGTNGYGYYNITSTTSGIDYEKEIRDGNGQGTKELRNILFCLPTDGGYLGKYLLLKKDTNGKMVGTNLSWKSSLKKESDFIGVFVPLNTAANYGGEGNTRTSESWSGNNGGSSIASYNYYYKHLVLDDEEDGKFTSPVGVNFSYNANDSVFSFSYAPNNIILAKYSEELIKKSQILYCISYSGINGTGNVISTEKIYSGVEYEIDTSTTKSVKYFYQNLYGNVGTSKKFNVAQNVVTSDINSVGLYFSSVTSNSNKPSATISASSYYISNKYKIYFSYTKLLGGKTSTTGIDYLVGNLDGFGGKQIDITINNGSSINSYANTIIGNDTNGYQDEWFVNRTGNGDGGLGFLNKITLKQDPIQTVAVSTNTINYTKLDYNPIIKLIPIPTLPKITTYNVMYKIKDAVDMSGETFFNSINMVVPNIIYPYTKSTAVSLRGDGDNNGLEGPENGVMIQKSSGSDPKWFYPEPLTCGVYREYINGRQEMVLWNSIKGDKMVIENTWNVYYSWKGTIMVGKQTMMI